MINYILSTASSGKDDYIYKCIEKNISEKIQSYILVPEQYSMVSEKEMLDRLGFDAQKYTSVLTFSRLSNMILSTKGPLRMKYIDGAGKNILALKSLVLCEDQLEFFSKNVHQRGFETILVSLFSEFKRYGITDEKLSIVIEKLENSELKRKLSDFKILYKKYDELLNEKNSDAEDNLKIVISKIKDCDFLSGKFYVNYFKSFTPPELDAIGELMKKADMTFAFLSGGQEGSNAFKSSAYTMKKLDEIASAFGISKEKNIILSENKKFESSPDLLFLKENCLSFAPQKYDKAPENIRIIRPKNYYNEVLSAAKIILKLMREENYSQDDFLVLISNAENYEDILPVIFEKYGLCSFVDKKTPFCAKPFPRFILSILEILSFGFSYERIMTVLRCGLFEISKKEIDLFENYFLAASPTHRQLLSEAGFSYNPDPKKFDMEIINSVKERIINPVTALSKAIKGRKTADKICTSIYNWLEDYGIKKSYENKMDALLKDGDEDGAREYETIWNTFAAVLSQIEDMLGESFMTYREFLEFYIAATSGITLGKTPSLLNQITVSETENYRSTNAKAVIVLGATDGEFPKTFSDAGTLSDKERTELFECGMELAPTAYEKLFDEQYLIYSVLTAPSEKLIISAPIADMEGKDLAKSEIITTISNIFPKIKEEFLSENPDYDIEFFLEGQNAAFDALENRLCLAEGDESQLAPLWKKIYDYFISIPKFSEKLLNIKNMIKVDKEKESLNPKTAELLYGKPLMLSVSKLEKYNACAFSYFMTYGLFADERKKAGVLSNDVGSVLHETLCTYFERKNKENADYKSLTRTAVKKEIEKIINDNPVLKENTLYENSSYYRYTLLRILDISAITAWKIVKFYAQSTFRPYGFEIKIGTGGTFPPYVINLKTNEAQINGFIDRMDISEIDGKKYFNIVDYKSSEKKVDKTLAECGVRFQPLLYAGIVKENIENSNPAAMLYMKMDDPVANAENLSDADDADKLHLDEISLDGIVLNDENIQQNLDADFKNKHAVHYIPTSKSAALSSAEMDMMLKNALDTAEKTSQKISDGEIEINPVFIKSNFDACEYCKFSDVCKKDDL